MAGRLERQGGRRHRWLQRHRPRDGATVRAGGGPGRHRRPRRGQRGSGSRTRSTACSWHCDVTDAGAGRATVPHGEGALRQRRRRVQQRGDLTARRRLDPHHGPRGLAPGPGGQPHQRLPLLQGGPALHARAGQGVDHQHRVVRGRDGRRDVARSPTPPARAACCRCHASWACSSPARGCGSTRSAPGRSTPRCCRSCSPRTPSGPRAGWCTSRSAGSPSPRRSPTPCCSSPATSPASSPPRLPGRRRHLRRLRHPALSEGAPCQRPVIGITCYVEPASRGDWVDQPSALLPYDYVRHVEQAGAIALLVPPRADADEDLARAVLDRLDGLILAGGADVAPGRYGATPHPSVQEPRPDRDALELALAAAVTRGGAPGPGHLPRHAGDGGRGRRRPRAARARPGGPRPALARVRGSTGRIRCAPSPARGWPG